MSESKETKKYHPSPAKEQSGPSKESGQTDGRNRDISGSAKDAPTVDVIKEQKRTEQGYKKTS